MAVIGSLIAQLSLDSASFIRDLNRAGDSLDKAGRRMVGIGQNISTYVSAPLIGFGALALKTAADFEEGMNRVAAVSGATAPELKQLREEAQRLGASVEFGKFSARDAAEGMAFLGQAGFKTTQIIGAMPATLQLVTSAQIGLAESADIVTNVLTGYGKTVDELGAANDVLVKTFISSNVSLTQLGESMKFVAPLATAAGVEFEETAAAIGLMGNAGIQAEMAGTSLRNMIAEILEPTPKATKLMQELGVSFTDTADRMIPLVEIVRQLEPHLENAGIFIELFGKRAGPSMAALVKQGSGALSELTNELRNSAGTAADVAAIQMQGFATSLEGMKSSFEALQISIAQSGLLAFVDKLTKRLADIFQVLSELEPQWLRFATVVAGVAAAIGPIILALGGITILLGAMLTPLGLWVTAFVGASVAIVTALVTVWDHTQRIGDITFRVGDVMIAVWETVKTSILGVLQGMGQLAEAVFKFVTGDFQGAMEAWQLSAEGFAASLTAPLHGWEAFKSSIEDSERARQEIDALADTMFGIGNATDAVKDAVAGLDLPGLGEAASSALRPFEELELQVTTLRQQAALLQEAMREPLAGSVIGEVSGLDDIAQAEQMMRDWAAQNDLVGASYEEIATKIGRTRGEIASTLRSARELQTFVQAGTQLAEQQQQQALLLQFAGEETEEYRAQLRVLQLKTQMGDDLAGQLREQVQLVEQQSTALKTLQVGRDITANIKQQELLLQFAGKETEEYRIQSRLLELKATLGEAAAKSLEDGVRQAEFLSKELASVRLWSDLSQTLEQQRLLLSFAGQETEEYRVQIRLLEIKNRLSEEDARLAEHVVRQIEAQRTAIENVKRAQEEWNRLVENAVDSIQAAFTDMFEDIFSGGVNSFSDLADSIKRIFIRLAAEIATLMVIRPVLAGAFGGLAGGGFGGGGVTGLGGLLGGAAGAINRFGTNFGLAGAPIGPTAAPWAGAPGGFQFGQAGGWSGQTLTGLLGAGAMGATIGGVGSSLLGVNSAGQTGAAIGGALGGAIGSVVPVVGTLLGSVAGSVLGGFVGSFFGGKPSDKGQVSEINFLTNAVKEWGQTGEKFSQENRDAATTFAGAAIQLADTLEALTGGTISGGLKIHVGSRDALRLFRGEELVGRTTDPKEFVTLITQTLAGALKGAGGIEAQILKRADTTSPETLIADIQFAQVFRELTQQARPLTNTLEALKDQFAGARAQARRLGLDVDRLKDAQRDAVRSFRQGLMTELRVLAGEITPASLALEELRSQFRAVKREAGDLGLDRGEIVRLQQQAVRQFRQGMMAELRALAGDATPAVQAFEALRAQFRAAKRDASDIGLNRDVIKRLQQQATSQFRQDFLADLNQSAGAGTNTFIDQMKELTQHFAQARKEARGIGISVVRVNQIQARAVANLQASFMDDLQGLTGAAETFADQVKALADRFALARREARALGLDVAEIRKLEAQAIENIAQRALGELEGQLAQQSRAIRDHFSSILDPLRDFRSSLDFGPLSANAPAQQFQLAQSQFQSLASQAANNNAQALRDLPSAAQAFIQQAQQFGASPAQAEAVAQVQRAFDAVISQQERMESEFTRDLPDAIDDSAEKQVKALRQEIDRLVVAINEVKRELQRPTKRVA